MKTSGLPLEALHQLVERLGQCGLHLACQMGVDLRGTSTVVAQVFLNDSQVETGFQQMRGIGMPQRVHMGPLGDTAVLERPSKRALQTAACDRATAGSTASSNVLTTRGMSASSRLASPTASGRPQIGDDMRSFKPAGY